MIELHRLKSDAESDNIEQAFRELSLAYKTETYSDSGDTTDQLPQIKDGDNWVSGPGEIEKWLNELRSELEWQRSLSGDGCYIDPESGDVC